MAGEQRGRGASVNNKIPAGKMAARVQRPYLDIFKAPGSPCHELTSSDNSTSMRI